MSNPSSKKGIRTTEDGGSKTKEHKFYLPKNLSTGSLKKEGKAGTPTKNKNGSLNKYEGENRTNKYEDYNNKYQGGSEGKYEGTNEQNNHRANEGNPPKIPINQTTNINIINISSINNPNRGEKTSSFSYINNENKPEFEMKHKANNSKGKGGEILSA